MIGVRRGLVDVRQRGLRDGTQAVGQRRERLFDDDKGSIIKINFHNTFSNEMHESTCTLVIIF